VSVNTALCALVAAVVACVACGGSEGNGGDDANDETQPGHGGFSGHGGGSAGLPAAAECTIRAPTACPSPPPRYADVKPIFEGRCTVCHAGAEGVSWPLNTYAHVATWRDTIRGALLQCTMPPPDSGMQIPEEESLLVLSWIRCGMPL